MTEPSRDQVDPTLIALFDYVRGDQWRPLISTGAHNVHIRAWRDGSVDTVAVTEKDVTIERTNPEGVPVWRPKATDLAEQLDELRALPGPFAPDAPRTPMRDHDPRRG